MGDVFCILARKPAVGQGSSKMAGKRWLGVAWISMWQGITLGEHGRWPKTKHKTPKTPQGDVESGGMIKESRRPQAP
jgi:hypothetical protein